MAIPGIGHYTAAAIRNFALNIPTPCLDTNIRRIVHRTFVGPENADGVWKKDDRYLLKLAGEVLEIALQPPLPHPTSPFGLRRAGPLPGGEREVPKSQVRNTADWHAALMDFGSLVCTKKNPKWDICPLAARGLSKAAYRVVETRGVFPTKKEPGRFVGSKYIPNRIFRGKIIEELRDEPAGLPLDEIGRRVCIDWSPREHRKWLREIVEKLEKDQLLMWRQRRFLLVE